MTDGYKIGQVTLREQAASPNTIVAGEGAIYVKNLTPTTLVFVDDTNTEHSVLTSGAPVIMSGMANASGSYIGQYQVSGVYATTNPQIATIQASGFIGFMGIAVGSGIFTPIVNYTGADSIWTSGHVVTAAAGSPVIDPASGQIICQEDGIYRADFQCYIGYTDPVALTESQFTLMKNGTAISGIATVKDFIPAVSGIVGPGVNISDYVQMQSGDYINAAARVTYPGDEVHLLIGEPQLKLARQR